MSAPACLISGNRLVRAWLWLSLLALWLPGGFATPAARAQSPEITIVSATFGAGKRQADVTATVTVLLFSAEKSFVVNSKSLKGDPAPGSQKHLSISYKYHGEEKKYTIAAGKSMTYQKLLNHAMGLPEDADPAVGKSSQILTGGQMGGIVMIEGDKGVATGFLAKVNDIDCVVTNLHVLGDNEKFTVKSLTGEVIPLSAQGIIGAKAADIALLRLAAPMAKEPPLVLAQDVLKEAKITDQVVIVGNRLGGGVATQTTGSIKGIGPARIEVDAAFQSGNSGSPIYDVASQRVVGVAAFTQTLPVGNLVSAKGPPAFRIETRWFGYRLDTVAKWETIEWPKWRSQIQRVNEYRQTSLAILGILHGDLNAAKDQPDLWKIVSRYRETVTKETKAKEARTMLTQLKARAAQDSKALDQVEFYDYFRTCPYWNTNANEQTKFRGRLLKELDDLDAMLALFLRRE